MRTLVVLLALTLLVHAQESTDTDKAVRLYKKGYRLFDQGKLDKSIPLFEQALEADPELYLAEHALGGVYVSKKDYAQAERHYRSAIRIKKDFAEAHNSLGVVLAAQEKHIDAIKSYRAAITLKPKYTIARIHMAESQLQGGRADLAVRTLHETLRVDPKAHRALYILARIAAERGDSKIALQHLDDAIEIKADFAEAHIGRGEVLRGLNKIVAAQEAFATAVRHAPKNIRAWFALGVTATKRQDWKAAAAAFEQAHKLRPQAKQILSNYGIALLGRYGAAADRADLELGIEMLKRSLLKDPNQPGLSRMLSRAREQLAVLDAKAKEK